MLKYCIFGAGEHGKVIADCIISNNSYSVFFIDDNQSAPKEWNDIPIFTKNYLNRLKNSSLIIGVGDNKTRKKIAEKLSKYQFSTFLHPSSYISKFAQIGKGSVAMAFSLVQPNSKVGNHCIINSRASIDHDCIIGNYVHIGPGSILCGNIQVGDGALIGAGSTILPSIKIGKWATIGAGSVIIKDVPDFATVVGNPARIIKMGENNA
jgi:acetyltransferase EpsM